MEFLTDLITFLCAAIVNLITLLSGVVGIMIDMLRRRYGWEVPNNWYVWIIVVCLMFGMFSAWRDEHTGHLASQEKLSVADREVASLEAQPRIGKEAKAQIEGLTQANQQLQQKVIALEQQSLPRTLTDEQKKKLTEALSKVPLGSTYELLFTVISGCEECSGYMEELWTIWSKVPGWRARRTTISDTISRAIGLFVPIGTEGCSSEELYLVMSALDTAGIKYERGQTNIYLGSGPECHVLVGRKPQQ